MSFINSYRYASGDGPANPCGTGASYPAGWKFLHTEISGGLGSWGNMLKVEGFNNFGATLTNVGDGTQDFCYLDGEIDKAAMDSFYSSDADVETQYDQLELNDITDFSNGSGYIKLDNDLNSGGTEIASPTPISGGLGLLQNSSARTICMVVNYPSTPNVNEFFGVIKASTGSDQWVWSGNGVSLIMRFSGPNQGYFYNGLRSSGTKLIIWTYDGTTPINRSGINLYWNGSTTAEVPAGIYNSGAPAVNTISGVSFGVSVSNGDSFFKELDIFDHAFNASEITAALDVYSQKYTFS